MGANPWLSCPTTPRAPEGHSKYFLRPSGAEISCIRLSMGLHPWLHAFALTGQTPSNSQIFNFFSKLFLTLLLIIDIISYVDFKSTCLFFAQRHFLKQQVCQKADQYMTGILMGYRGIKSGSQKVSAESQKWDWDMTRCVFVIIKPLTF